MRDGVNDGRKRVSSLEREEGAYARALIQKQASYFELPIQTKGKNDGAPLSQHIFGGCLPATFRGASRGGDVAQKVEHGPTVLQIATKSILGSFTWEQSETNHRATSVRFQKLCEIPNAGLQKSNTNQIQLLPCKAQVSIILSIVTIWLFDFMAWTQDEVFQTSNLLWLKVL